MPEGLIVDKGPSKRRSIPKKRRALASPIVPRYLDDPLPNEEPIVPNPESTDYRSISEKKIYGQFYFNAQNRSVLREFTVSGAKLVFDNSRSNIALKKLSDKKDIGRIMIVADSVHVDIPLRFPQTEVVIFARQLVFGEKGSIDITPESKTVRPGKKKIPVGSGRFKGVDGNDGNDAGLLLLSVNSLCIPESDRDKPTIRIIARGADGQPGGDGGLVDEKLGQKQPPSNVTWKMFRDKLFKTPFCMIPLGIPITLEVAEATGGLITKLFGGPSMEGMVTDHCKSAFEWHYVLHVDAKINLPPGLYLRKWGFELGKKIKPLNGSDAYPAGTPGKGGDGGNVTLLGKLAFSLEEFSEDPLSAYELNEQPQFPFSTIVDISGGKAGTSRKMEGQSPALKKPRASFGTVTISFDGSPHKRYRSEDVTPRKGKDAAAPTAVDGAVGNVMESRDEPTPFIHEYNAEAMVSYAKDACMVQNRKLAGQVVTAYLEGIDNVREHTTSRVEALKAELDTLNQQLNSDVDIYGNQRGWVPYLSVVAAKNIFDATAKSAFNTMYLCGKMKDRYDSMEDNLDCLSATRVECEGKLANARKELGTAQDQSLRLQGQFDDLTAQIVTLQAELDGLHNEMKQWAELDEKNKALYAGMAETVGGAVQLLGAGIQCIPVGQPATGIVGGIIQFGGETGGNIVSSLIEGGNLFDAAGQLTEQADAFFTQNRDDIAKAVSKAAFKENNEKLKVAQKKYKEVGKKNKALAQRKALLNDLVKAPADELTSKFENLYREQRELAKTAKTVSKSPAKKRINRGCPGDFC